MIIIEFLINTVKIGDRIGDSGDRMHYALILCSKYLLFITKYNGSFVMLLVFFDVTWIIATNINFIKLIMPSVHKMVKYTLKIL